MAFVDQRQAILDGLVSAQAEGTGWNALLSTIPVTAVVRTSGTVVTITLPALGSYNITADETITCTVPAAALTAAVPLIAAPTMTIVAGSLEFLDTRQAILNGLDSAQAEATGWDALRSTIPVSAVVRTSSSVVTITLPSLPTYNITATETITATVPASAVTAASAIVATPTISVTTATTPTARPAALLLMGVGGGGNAAAPPPVDPNVRYVATATSSPAGSNANSGTIEAPWLTFNYAVSQLEAGMTLYARSGIYAEALSGGIPSGTSWSNKVLIQNYSGESVTLRPVGTDYVLHFRDDQQYIEVDGIHLDGSSTLHGVVKIEALTSPDWNPHHIRIRDAILTGIGTSQSGHVSLVLVTAIRTGYTGGNEFINLTLQRSTHDITTFRTNGFYIQGPNNLIEWCVLNNLNGFGLQTYNQNSPRTEPDSNIVRYNIIRNMPVTTERTQGINIAQGSNNKVYGNLIHNLDGVVGGSIGLYVFTGAGTGTELYNNTIYDIALEGLVVETGVSSVIVRNNVSHECGGGNMRLSGTSITASHNHTSGVDPLFVSPLTGDFTPQSGATATILNTGTNAGNIPTYVTVDIEGGVRPVGVYDIGAVERQ
jgi:hypothetical protein